MSRPRNLATLKWPSALPRIARVAALRGAPLKRRAIWPAHCKERLTLWLSNLMLAGADIDAEMGHLEHALAAAAAPVVMVANEVGSGIVPDHPLGRRFRDMQGVLNQRIAARADRVVLMVAGLPLAVKGTV